MPRPVSDHSDDLLVRAVRRACSVTLSNWATEPAIRDELAKEDFVRDLEARLSAAREMGQVIVGFPGRQKKWRTR